MRYHYDKPPIVRRMYGERHICDHEVYSRCTLFKIRNKGLAVIQQYYDEVDKHTWWDEIEPWIANEIYLNENFKRYFDNMAAEKSEGGLYPTVTVRQIMWALKMKPLKREKWETVFDRKKV